MPVVTDTKKPPRNQRRPRLLMIGIGVLVCLLAAAMAVRRARAGGGLRNKLSGVGGEEPVYAAVSPVKRENIATSLSIAGQFLPYQNVELHAKVAGYIRNIYVDIGDRVHKWQV